VLTTTEYYNRTATHNYVFGVARKGRVKAYFITLDREGYAIVFNEKPTEAKRQTVIKYRSTAQKVAYFESHAVKVVDLMSIEELKASCRHKVNRKGQTYTENCGECFEWLISEMCGGEQNAKANLKNTEGGDITVNGIQYQVKYEKGAITISG
jgi:hypothetical protein